MDRSSEGDEAVPAEAERRRGWWRVLLRVWESVNNNNISLLAAGLAFYAFVAIPSAITALVSIYGLVFDPRDVEHQLEATRGILPRDVVNLLSDQLTNVTAHPNGSLGLGLVISVSIALWSTSLGASSLMSALNVAYAARETRSVVRFHGTSLALTLTIIGFTLVALALIAVLPPLLSVLPLGETDKRLASLARWPILVVLVMMTLTALYRFAPSRVGARWRWLSWGAAAAAVLWLAASAGFSLYVGVFAGYDKTYGPLGAVVVLLMWLYISAFVVLLGAALNAEIEHPHQPGEPGEAPKRVPPN